MKKLLLVSLLLTSLFLTGCSSNDDYESSYDNAEVYDDYNSSRSCDEPSNPYGDGGGHDAGFNRAEETGGYCDGNSDSFNEGCEEYYSQLEEYNNCVDNN